MLPLNIKLGHVCCAPGAMRLFTGDCKDGNYIAAVVLLNTEYALLITAR